MDSTKDLITYYLSAHRKDEAVRFLHQKTINGEVEIDKFVEYFGMIEKFILEEAQPDHWDE